MHYVRVSLRYTRFFIPSEDYHYSQSESKAVKQFALQITGASLCDTATRAASCNQHWQPHNAKQFSRHPRRGGAGRGGSTRHTCRPHPRPRAGAMRRDAPRPRKSDERLTFLSARRAGSAPPGAAWLGARKLGSAIGARPSPRGLAEGSSRGSPAPPRPIHPLGPPLSPESPLSLSPRVAAVPLSIEVFLFGGAGAAEPDPRRDVCDSGRKAHLLGCWMGDTPF